MTLITDDEFEAMERLLARLLSDATPAEEAGILTLHDRLQRIYAAQHGLRASRDRLTALTKQTAQ
ncbi:MAG: hypothetical protein AB8C46_23580 [Burkholderiaceae bacterium]